MKKETVEKCLDFAHGKKTCLISYTAKSPDFPENLLIGSENEQYVRQCRAKGMTHQQIADEWNKVKRQVSYTIEISRKKEKFYHEWVEFWKEIEPVRDLRLDVLLDGTFPEHKLKKYEKRGVVTVGDFIMLSVRMSSSKALVAIGETTGGDWNKAKEHIYGKIREQIFLTVRIEN